MKDMLRRRMGMRTGVGEFGGGGSAQCKDRCMYIFMMGACMWMYAMGEWSINYEKLT